MKSSEKPKYVAEARIILKSLEMEKLIKDPNDLEEISKINRLIAIFTNFSSNDGLDLKKIFSEFQTWARRSSRAGIIKNRATDVVQFIGQKIEEMDIYVIEDFEEKKKRIISSNAYKVISANFRCPSSLRALFSAYL